jgi:hypothetical protein
LGLKARSALYTRNVWGPHNAIEQRKVGVGEILYYVYLVELVTVKRDSRAVQADKRNKNSTSTYVDAVERWVILRRNDSKDER